MLEIRIGSNTLIKISAICIHKVSKENTINCLVELQTLPDPTTIKYFDETHVVVTAKRMLFKMGLLFQICLRQMNLGNYIDGERGGGEA